jgi:pyridoxamine 5'-phosphate oxidase
MELADLDPDPVVQFRRWLDDVVAAGLHEPTAMVLATAPAGDQAQPLARHVLLKSADHEGFTWVTNQRSRKGRQLAENPHACLVFPWYPIGRQVVVTGAVALGSDEESDAYFATRSRASQLAAWASEQSEVIPDRAWLDDRWDRFDQIHASGPVPRPPHWGIYRLTPDAIEFWHQGPNRMHDRFRFHRAAPDQPWSVDRLSP